MKFEYCTKWVSEIKMRAELEAFGEEGWELCAVHREEKGTAMLNTQLFFKRSKP